MKTVRKITLLSLVVLCCLILFGCGKKDEGVPPPPTAPDKPTVKVNAETAKELKQLRAAALKCKAALDAKIAETEQKTQELIKSLASDKPKEERTKLKAETNELNKAAEALGKQLEGYVAQLKEKGGDISGLSLEE